MDAKTLLNDNEFVSGLYIRYPQERADAIKSALSLAAAVEGEPEATPETDAMRGWDDNGGDTFKLDPSGDMVRVEDCSRMELQRNSALCALKAERERTNNALLAFKEERERAGKMHGLIGKCLGVIKAHSPAEGEIVLADEAEQIDALIDELSVAQVALAAQEGSR